MKHKVVKIILVTFLVTMVVCLVGTAIAVGERTLSYMNRQKMNFETAFQWACEDYNNMISDIFEKKGEEDTIEFDFCNKHVTITGCVNLK